MHNGCLLLLACVAVFQPIASYTERGLVDGRHQRCDYRTSVCDTGPNFHGTYRFNKPAVEDRRLNNREDIREFRRNEVRGETLRIASSSDRRLPDTVERNRNYLSRFSRDRIHRDERDQEIRRERISAVQETHQARAPSRRGNSRLSDDRTGSQRIGNGINSDTLRFRKQREVRIETSRARDNGVGSLNERRIDRRMDTRRSVSRIHLDRNADREVLSRRSISELRSSSPSGQDTVSRVRTNEELRLNAQDATSLDRNDRRTSRSERLNDEQRQRDSRIQLTYERRNIRDSASRKVRNDRSSVNGRDEAQRFQRAQSADNRRDIRNTENVLRLERSVRSVNDRVSQNDRSDSRVLMRETAAESRTDARDARSMVRIRSLERSAEYRKDSRSLERVLENRRSDRNVERETRQNINNIRTAETRNSNRDTCVYDRKQSSDQQMFRIMSRERSDETRHMTPNNDLPAFRAERTDESRRIVREVTSRQIRTERIEVDRRDAIDHIGLRAFKTERSEKIRRDARNKEVQAFRNERADESRKHAGSVGVRSFRTERYAESQLDVRNIELRKFRTERNDESRRDVRNIAARSFTTERDESQRGARNVNSRLFRDAQTGESRQDARNAEVRAFRTERTDESRRGARDVGIPVLRSDRSGDGQRDARKAEIRALKTERSDENQQEVRAFRTKRSDKFRRDTRNIDNRLSRATDSYSRGTRDIERQSRSHDRVIDSRREIQNHNRDVRLQDSTLGSRRTVRNIESRTEDERTYIRRASLEGDIRSMGRERTMASPLNEKASRDSRTSMLERRLGNRQERVTENRRDARIVLMRSADSLTQRKTDRAVDDLSRRDSSDSRRVHTLREESRSDTRKTTERDNLERRHVEAGSRNGYDADFARKREFQSMFRNFKQTENETPIMSWQYIFYALQGLYICGLLMQLNNGVEKKTRVTWWPTSQHLIKVD